MSTMAKALVALVVVFLFTLWKGCTELRYAVGGEIVTGTVEGFAEVTGRRGRRTGNISVEYRFPAGEKVGRGNLVTSPEGAAAFAAGQAVEVLYLPDSPIINTLTSHRQRYWLWICLLLFAAMGVVGVLAFKQAQADVARDKRR